MMTKDKALKMAIEQMNIYAHMYLCEYQCQDEELLNVIQACKEALEQPAQEPVGFISTVPVVTPQAIRADKNDVFNIPVYTHPAPQPAQEPVAWMKSALDNARDVCKYLDHDMIKEAKAHTTFFWSDIDKIRDFDDTHPAPSCKCEECGMKYCECGERK